MDNKKTVLLADDAKLFLELEKSFLQRSGIEILTAGNGSQALKLARQHCPDLAFLDLNMPEMDGDECCRAIKQDPALQDMAIVMVTTEGRTKHLERCRAAGCDEILLKPINRTEFLKTAERLLQLPTRNERFKTKIKVQYGVDAETSLTEFSIDLSAGGLYISTRNPLAEGEMLVIRFSLEGHAREIICQAQIVWVNPPQKLKKPTLPSGMGIRFVDISMDDLRAIHKFMASKQFEPSW